MFWRTLCSGRVAAITARFEALKPVLDERSRRLVAAAESQASAKAESHRRQSNRHFPAGDSSGDGRFEGIPTGLRQDASGEKAAVEREAIDKDASLKIRSGESYWSPLRAEIRKRRCDGPARASAS